MSSSSIIDTSDGTPSLRLKVLASTLVGTVLYGYWLGFIDLVQTVRGGLTGALDGLSSFLSVGLIPGLIDIPSRTVTTALAVNAEFIYETFGPAAQVVALLEVVLVIGFVLWVFEQIVDRIRGGLA